MTYFAGKQPFDTAIMTATEWNGRIAWNDVLKVRLYERPTQKLKDVGVRVKVGLRTDDRVHLDCTEPLGGSYVPVRLDLDGTYLRVSVESYHEVDAVVVGTNMAEVN